MICMHASHVTCYREHSSLSLVSSLSPWPCITLCITLHYHALHPACQNTRIHTQNFEKSKAFYIYLYHRNNSGEWIVFCKFLIEQAPRSDWLSIMIHDWLRYRRTELIDLLKLHSAPSALTHKWSLPQVPDITVKGHLDESPRFIQDPSFDNSCYPVPFRTYD